jgi:two-component system cell cycle sensor histidine kinase/response regulator CckA
MTESRQQICWLLDPLTLGAIYLSPVFDEIRGCRLDRLDPKSYQTLIHPDDLGRVVRSLGELESTDLTERKFRIVCPENASRWAFASTSVARNAHGQITAIVGVIVATGEPKTEERGVVDGEDCYRDFVGGSGDLTCTHTLSGILLSISDSMSSALCYSRDEIVNTSMKKVIPPEAYGEFDTYLSRIRTTGTAWGLLRIVTKVGERRVLQYHSTLRSQSGRLSIIRTVAHDVTEQESNEVALRTAEQNFSKAFMNSPLAIAITTLEGGEFIDVNEAFQAQTGFSRPEVIGKKGVELGVWVDSGQRLNITAEIKAGGRIRNQETQFRHSSGRIQTILYSAELIEVGGKQCVFAASEDITQRKHAEETLRRSEANYRSLFLTSPCGMYQVALDGGFILVNNALVELLGYDSIEELQAKNLEKDIYVSPDDRYPILDEAEQINPLKTVEVRWRRKDGTVILVRAHARGWMSDECGKIVGLEIMVEDVTKQRMLDQKMHRMQKIESLALFAGGIAHDFNNILTAVLGYGQLALKTLGSRKGHANALDSEPEFKYTMLQTKTQLQHIVDAALHGQSLTSQLLSVSRDQLLPIYPLNLDAEIKNISEVIRRLLREDIEVDVHLECQFQQILGERGAFGQVILNLCVNARDAMPKGGRLTVRTFPVDVKPPCEEHVGVPSGSYVVLEVTDTGCGMHKTIQDRIFEPFFTTKSASRGTGLGLYTVYATLNRCGGHIRIESEPGRGSTFYLYLPVVIATPTQVLTVPDRRLEKLGKGIAMVVEDDDSVRELVATHLENCGFRVLRQANGTAAAQECEQLKENIEFLVTDVVMPELSGPELVRKLKESQPRLRVLYMTGSAAADILPAELLGPSAKILYKPFDERQLGSAINQLLCRPRLVRKDAKELVFAAKA